MGIPEGLQFPAIIIGIFIVSFLLNLPFSIRKARRERLAAEKAGNGNVARQ